LIQSVIMSRMFCISQSSRSGGEQIRQYKYGGRDKDNMSDSAMR